jgi:aminoglycoside phosphotransferase (APT) family kinase protein
VIPGPDGVTGDWLTGVLRTAGHPHATVRSVSARRIGSGQMGCCLRLTLDVVGDPDAPRHLIAKFPSDDPTSRQTGVALKSYLKEVTFYRELQPRVSITTPRCYYAAIDGDGPTFALVLEDLQPATPGDQLAGCAPAVAEAAVTQLVGLHAPSWNDTTLRGLDWLGAPDAETSAMVRELYVATLPGFLDRCGSSLATDEAAIIERVASAAGPPFVYPPEPCTLVHIDYRLDNLLIDDTRTPPRVTAVDWQSISLGSPLSDVAYFLGAGLLPEARRAVEENIVRAYHHALEAAGVGDYPWARCWADYRRSAFAGFLITVIASMIVLETPRGNALFSVMARRHARHALDLGADEFL